MEPFRKYNSSILHRQSLNFCSIYFVWSQGRPPYPDLQQVETFSSLLLRLECDQGVDRVVFFWDFLPQLVDSHPFPVSSDDFPLHVSMSVNFTEKGSTWEAKVGRSPWIWGQLWTEWVPGQPGLHRESISPKTATKIKLNCFHIG